MNIIKGKLEEKKLAINFYLEYKLEFINIFNNIFNIFYYYLNILILS